MVQEWKRRGLLSPTAQVRHKKDLVDLAGGASWFVRRNRHTPNVADLKHRSLEYCSPTSWIARRNTRFSGPTLQLPHTVKHVSSPRRSASLLVPPSPRDSPPFLPEAKRLNSRILLDIQSRLPQLEREQQGGIGSESEDSQSEGPPSPFPTEVVEAGSGDHAPQIFLTLYDLCAKCINSMGHAVGLGVYHSGIEVHGVEYTFDNHTSEGSGLVWHTPYHAVRAASHCRRPG